jgi:CDGSH-type Zn-finger protein
LTFQEVGIKIKVNKNRKQGDKMENKKPLIKLIKDGPYVVTGNVPLTEQAIVCDEAGTALKMEVTHEYPQTESYSLCRCGKSKNMPFCDGSHQKEHFDGTETAKKEYSGNKYVGKSLVLYDDEDLCASARFCHLSSGTWQLAENANDENSRELAIKSACGCIAGRLVIKDKATGEVMEPFYEPSIAIVQDPAAGVSSAIWVRGGIQVVSDNGELYEVRNRVTLCRCGKSRNKPFCDSMHSYTKFKDNKNS